MKPESAKAFGYLAPGEFAGEPHKPPPAKKKTYNLGSEDIQILDKLMEGASWRDIVREFRCGHDRIARIIRRNGVQEVLNHDR